MATDCDRGYDSSAEIHRELAKVARQQLRKQSACGGHRYSGCSQNLFMACPRCGTDCHCSPRDATSGERITIAVDPNHRDAVEESSAAPPNAATSAKPGNAATPADTFYRPQETQPAWRAEVNSRVDNFRSRRRRPATSAHASMRFDFDPRELAAPPGLASAEVRALPRLEPEVAKIIAFPKALPAPQAPAALDEVVPGEPRIVEAEAQAEIPDAVAAEVVSEVTAEWDHPAGTQIEDWERPLEALADPVEDATAHQVLEADPETALPQASPMADISLDPAPAEFASTFDLVEDDIALSIAPLFDRSVAAVVDVLVAGAATLLFLGVFFGFAKPELAKLPLATFAAVVGTVCWTAYQYIFLVYRSSTLGMQFAGLEVRTFAGEPAWANERRLRVLGLALSCASLGLGFWWALIDEDRLGWHDRITRSCLVRKDQD